MRWWVPLFLVVGLTAQEPAPVGIVRGDLLGWKGAASSGQLSILTKDLRIYQFAFDGKTYFERDAHPIRISDTRTGDLLEIVCDHGPSATLGYARSIQVLDRQPRKGVPRGHVNWPQTSATESIIPRGTVTLAGLVVRISPDRLVLRTRAGEEKSFARRKDTLYLENGSQVSAGSLKVNTRVFVRAGPTGEEEPEVFRVIWGSILLPGHE